MVEVLTKRRYTNVRRLPFVIWCKRGLRLCSFLSPAILIDALLRPFVTFPSVRPSVCLSVLDLRRIVHNVVAAIYGARVKEFITVFCSTVIDGCRQSIGAAGTAAYSQEDFRTHDFGYGNKTIALFIYEFTIEQNDKNGIQ